MDNEVLNEINNLIEKSRELYGIVEETNKGFIVGKWYKGLTWYSLAARCYKIDKDNNAYYDSYISHKGNFDKTDGVFSTNEDYINVPIHEIAQYLPENHPDLFNDSFLDAAY